MEVGGALPATVTPTPSCLLAPGALCRGKCYSRAEFDDREVGGDAESHRALLTSDVSPCICHSQEPASFINNSQLKAQSVQTPQFPLVTFCCPRAPARPPRDMQPSCPLSTSGLGQSLRLSLTTMAVWRRSQALFRTPLSEDRRAEGPLSTSVQGACHHVTYMVAADHGPWCRCVHQVCPLCCPHLPPSSGRRSLSPPPTRGGGAPLP